VLHVCPFSALPSLVARAKASHVITLLQEEILVERPERHSPGTTPAFWRVHDISEPLAGCVHPDPTHIEEIIAFARTWAGQGPMVVHCWAGISRSTAAAFTALCSINPDVPEDLIALHLRRASPTAYPNRLMIRLAESSAWPQRAHGARRRGDRARGDRGRGGALCHCRGFVARQLIFATAFS
jgi:predicted protein tyrosine phosphatase